MPLPPHSLVLRWFERLEITSVYSLRDSHILRILILHDSIRKKYYGRGVLGAGGNVYISYFFNKVSTL